MSDFEDPRHALRRHGLHPRKSFGQNFLIDPAVVDRITSAVDARPGMRVIEIGAGLGTLTRALVASGAEVVAIERDRDLVKVLHAELGTRVRVAEANAVTFDYRSCAAGLPTLIVGNLPYHLTAPLLAALVEQMDVVQGAVVMVQREVAERLAASPGTHEYGALSVLVQARCEVRIAFHVPATSFHPPPKVQSTVVRLDPSRPARIGARDYAEVREVVRAAFSQRRKKLRNALASLEPVAVVEVVLGRAGIDPARRPETLSVEEFARVADQLAAVRSEAPPDPTPTDPRPT